MTSPEQHEAPAPILEGPREPLTVARPAGSGRFLCQGDRVFAAVSDRKGVLEVVVDGRSVAEAMTHEFGPCGNVGSSPGAARRELLSAAGTTLEDVVALPRLPGAFMQWTAPDGRALDATLRWTVSGTTEPENTDAERLDLRAEDGTLVAYRISPAPEWSWSRDGDTWTIEARCSAPAGRAILWGVAAADRTGVVKAALDSPARFEPQWAMMDGWIEELGREHLRTRTGVHAIDTGLEWAKARAGGHDRPSLERLQAQVRTGLLREAAVTLEALGRANSPDFGEALGEFLVWSGDYGAPNRFSEAFEEWLARAEGRDARHEPLIDGLDGLGFSELADAVRALPDRSAPLKPASGFKLPMAGRPEAPPEHDPESPWIRFRARADAAADGAVIEAGDPAYGAILALCDEVLRIRGEGSIARVELRPHFSRHLTSFQVEGIRFARGSIDFRMDREETGYRFLFQPSRGAMPLNVVFEPTLEGTGPWEALVDGGPGSLDFTYGPETTTPRLQFPVDRERTVEFRIAEATEA